MDPDDRAQKHERSSSSGGAHSMANCAAVERPPGEPYARSEARS